MLLDEGIRYPLRGERTRDRFAIGGILGLAVFVLGRMAATLAPSLLVLVPFTLAFVVVAALLGYVWLVVEAALDGADDPPAFAGVRTLLGRGLRASALAVVYLVPPLVAVVATLYGAATSGANGDIGFQRGVVTIAGSTTILVLALAFGYAFPAGFVRAVRDERLRAGLALRRLRPILGNGAYFLTWMGAALLLLLAWGLLLAAGAEHTLVGVVAVFFGFYCHVAAARLVTLGYQRALGLA